MLRCSSTAILSSIACLLTGASAAPFINEFHAENAGQVLTSGGALTPGTGLADDADGNSSDWIELRNPDAVTVSLNGWALSNDPSNPGKWVFPNVSMGASVHLRVFASGKDWKTGTQYHTNFKLSNSGALLLSQPDGMGGWTVVHQIGTAAVPYPPQKPRFSYGFAGLTGPGGSLGYLEVQSPTGTNSAPSVSSFVEDVTFSVKRGFYDSAQSVTLTTPTLGATIIYTTDGSEPSTISGTQVPAANGGVSPVVVVNVGATTCLRARAMKSGLGSTDVETHTYIFPSLVLGQNDSYVIQPYTNWGHDKGDANTTQADAGEADWSMDSRVTGNSNPEDQCVTDDLKEIPTVSIVLNWTEMFGASGIYIAGEGIQKQASFELINPKGDKISPNSGSSQGSGSVHIFGGTSTQRWKTDKLSMRFNFWGDLSTNVFGDSGRGEYNTLVLDARLNQVWTHSQDGTQRNRADYVRDMVMSDFERAMGNPGTHGQHVHVYINGLYWGLYSLHERPEEKFAAGYFGGDDDDYDVVKHGPSAANFLVAGKRLNPTLAISNTNHSAGVNYNSLLTLAAADLSTQASYDALAAKLDIPSFINYILLNFYAANDDWAHQNWYASYNRVEPSGKWRFHSWDAEHVFKTNNADSTRNGLNTSAFSDKNGSRGPTYIHHRLAGLLANEWTDSGTPNPVPSVPGNAEYRRMFGDVAHKLLYNGGLFTPAKAKTVFEARFSNINEAIRGESARWGDSGPSSITAPSAELHLRFSNSGSFVSWNNERLRILNTVLDGGTNRTNSLISQLRTRGLYPSLDAPVFSQHGGFVPVNYNLTMTNPGGAGVIYFTTDGTDPRVEFTGAVRGTATQYTTAVALPSSRTVKARVLNAGVWSALNEAYFSVGAVAAASGNLVISKIHYRPGAPTADEINAGHTDRSDFEFVEILNVSGNAVNLDGISFSAGLDITLLPGGVRELAPGGRALFVANVAAFEFRYGPGLPIAGTFAMGSGLSNDGETLTLVASNASTIFSVNYADTGSWPNGPDGNGPALVLSYPGTSNPALGSSWRQSSSANGSPGVDDRITFATWKTTQFPGGGPNADALADPDADGFVNMVECGLGTDPKFPNPLSDGPTATTVVFDAGIGPKPYLIFTVRKLRAAEELNWTAEGAEVMGTWSSSASVILPVGLATDNGDGTETRTYRAVKPVDAGGALFFRARVTGP